MSTTLADDIAVPAPSAPPARLARTAILHAFRAAVTAWVARQAVRRSKQQLMLLNNRMLKDIGLDRSEIGSALLDHRHERINGARPALDASTSAPLPSSQRPATAST